jgi:taurine dioxygenase
MIERPERGGETGWIDTAAAYDGLSPAMKERIENLEARFDFVTNICDMRFGKPRNMRFGTMGTQDFGKFPPVAHSLVWVHPESGRRSLVVSPIHLIEVVGLPRAEGDALLEALVEHATSGRFTYVHDWQVGDMVLWDNWRTLHTALGTPLGMHRVVQRTSFRGEREVGRVLGDRP